jgi:hypothetical protein
MTLDHKKLIDSGIPVTADSLANRKELPEGWVDHPKIPITWRGIGIGVAIFVTAIIVAFGSISFRRTQLEQTTRFWGPDAIKAMQLAPSVTLAFDADKDMKPIDLIGTPGLGHLRHALLEQKHYLWETEENQPLDTLKTESPNFATLYFTDPREDDAVRIPHATIRLELQGGWVGTADGSRRVQLTERAQPAVRHFLMTIRNYQKARSDFRDDG